MNLLAGLKLDNPNPHPTGFEADDEFLSKSFSPPVYQNRLLLMHQTIFANQQQASHTVRQYACHPLSHTMLLFLNDSHDIPDKASFRDIWKAKRDIVLYKDSVLPHQKNHLYHIHHRYLSIKSHIAASSNP